MAAHAQSYPAQIAAMSGLDHLQHLLDSGGVPPTGRAVSRNQYYVDYAGSSRGLVTPDSGSHGRLLSL